MSECIDHLIEFNIESLRSVSFTNCCFDDSHLDLLTNIFHQINEVRFDNCPALTTDGSTPFFPQNVFLINNSR
jgi:hypothetical protein